METLPRAAVVIDPYSSGRYLLYDLKQRGIPIIVVRSLFIDTDYFKKPYEAHMSYFDETVDFWDCNNDVVELADRIKQLPYTVVAVFAASDPAVELSDKLADALQLQNRNKLETTEVRRDKAEMQEQLRRHGVPACDQIKSGDLDELCEWATNRNQWPVVAKPLAGCGSDGVYICESVRDIQTAHREVVGGTNPMGAVNVGLALQEFLDGTEYMFDTVSYKGQHLITAIWMYTKVRGLPWCETAIFPTHYEMIPASGKVQDEMAEYVFKVLDAVGLEYGVCHTEIFATRNGPRLVEVNGRMHGLQAPFCIEQATGTSLATYFSDSLVNDGQMIKEKIASQKVAASPPPPSTPSCFSCFSGLMGGSSGHQQAERYLYPLNKHTVTLILICPQEGYLVADYGAKLKSLSELSSVVEVNVAKRPGEWIDRTTSIPTVSGTVILVHEDEDVIKRDMQTIRDLEQSSDFYVVSDAPVCVDGGAVQRVRGMSIENVEQMVEEEACDVQEISDVPSFVEIRGEVPDAVVIVDPYSSGKYLLYDYKRMGVPVICVRSSELIGDRLTTGFEALLPYLVEVVDFNKFDSLDTLAEFISLLPYKVVSVMAGSEPGVPLAERLSEHLNMPTANGTELLAARTEKSPMQDRLRECGVRSCEQVTSPNVEELLEWARARNEWPVVAKPLFSAGSDSIFFCRSEDDIVSAHAEITTKRNVIGVVNTHVVLQEFLDGDEYIIDTQSRDGKHIVCAMWVYSKRRGLPWLSTAIIPAHNKLLEPTGPEQDMLVDYVFQVLDAFGYKYGPCHTEVMLTKRGPVLVEVNTRLHGVQGSHLVELTTGTGLSKYAIDVAYGGGEMFERKYREISPIVGRFLYPMIKNCYQLILHSNSEGVLQTDVSEKVRELNLPSLFDVGVSTKPGGQLAKTIDVLTAAGFVMLVHEDEEQILNDIEAIRRAEASGEFYVVEKSGMSRSRLQSVESIEKIPNMQVASFLEEEL